MKSRPKGAGPEVIEHWYSLVSGQHFSSLEFYGHIERAVQAQEMPGLEVSSVDLSEGGALSAKRVYLRFQRERITFDVCAAPVGINYFFSYRFYVAPAIVSIWAMLAVLFALWIIFIASIRVFGFFNGPILLFGGCVLLVWFMRNAIGMGLRDFDATLLKIPLIGPIYERYFRADSYYRQDVRIAYCSIVSEIVKQEVARITGEKGIKLLREHMYSPAMNDLYRTKDTPISHVSEPLSEPPLLNA